MVPPSSQATALAAETLVARCREVATLSDIAGSTTRLFLGDGMRRANDRVAAWMRSAGMDVRMDEAGNLRGRTAGDGAPLVIASHLDTVLDAGAFDGVLGVLMGVALVEMCGASLPFPLEVIAFSEEEGVRFGAPFIGSRAVVGSLDDALLSRQDSSGVSVREALALYGLRVEELQEAHLVEARGYVEFHIEQGPVLESEGLALGVVSSIAGQSRYTLTFTGSANHAGTTPMQPATGCGKRSRGVDRRSGAVCAQLRRPRRHGGQHSGAAWCGERGCGLRGVQPGCSVCRRRSCERKACTTCCKRRSTRAMHVGWT